MANLDVQGLVKKFGSRAVLDGVSFSVPDGEFFVLLGPSGGGKSTILKILCGIETADAGAIRLGGKDITRLPPRERNVGMVFQDYGLYPHMNVFANIAYGLEARGYPKDEIARRVRESADRLGLTPHIERLIVDLSGGEQQRVALARALAKDADYYLFDEPISNLDPKLRAQARRDILNLHRLKKKPSVYVTHDQNEALAIGDRIAIVASGRLQQVGTADELLRRPANLFVAGFLGAPAMNLLPGRLVQNGDLLQAALDAGVTLSLPAEWRDSLANMTGQPVTVGIPPAAFLAPEQAAGDHLEGVIDFVEPLISEVIVLLKLSNGAQAAATFTGIDESELEIGAPLKAGVDTAQICLFDPRTELLLPTPISSAA